MHARGNHDRPPRSARRSQAAWRASPPPCCPKRAHAVGPSGAAGTETCTFRVIQCRERFMIQDPQDLAISAERSHVAEDRHRRHAQLRRSSGSPTSITENNTEIRIAWLRASCRVIDRIGGRMLTSCKSASRREGILAWITQSKLRSVPAQTEMLGHQLSKTRQRDTAEETDAARSTRQ